MCRVLEISKLLTWSRNFNVSSVFLFLFFKLGGLPSLDVTHEKLNGNKWFEASAHLQGKLRGLRHLPGVFNLRNYPLSIPLSGPIQGSFLPQTRSNLNVFSFNQKAFPGHSFNYEKLNYFLQLRPINFFLLW